MLKDLVKLNRSYRRFDQSRKINRSDLIDLVELTRYCASGRNLQTLKYFVSVDPELNAAIYPTLAWAGYLKDWDGPEEGERPTGYIVIIEDTTIGKNLVHDQGIVAQTMLLGAVEKGLGGCMIYSNKRKELTDILKLPEKYEVTLVLALGIPIEEVVIDPVASNGDIRYWRDDKKVHHVPKRSIDDLIIS